VVGSISSLGLGSQLQLQDILDQLRQADEQGINTKNDQVTALEAQIEEFTQLNNKLLTMKSHALDLTLNSSFLSRTVSNDNEDVLGASAIDGATVQSPTITVDRLAAKSSFQLTTAVESADTVFTGVDTTIGYQLGDTTVTLDVAAGTTYADLVELINDDADNPGLTASMIDSGETGDSYYLVLQADNTGEDYRISNLTGLTMTEVQGTDPGSLNSQITVDGITYQRQTNSITDVLAGVTLELKDTGSTSVSIAPDNTTLSETISGLVEAYNDLVQEISTKVAYDEETGKPGILANTTLRSLVFDLQNLMNTTVEANAADTITSMYSLGMEFNRDGTITLDTDVLDAALADNLEAVQAFFLGDDDQESEGFADLVNERLRTLTSVSGLLATEKNTTQDRIDNLELQIETETARLDKKYEIMTRQFIELDRYMNQMSSIAGFLTSQFASLDQQS
jgi:flagellar hook-associated protein 2